MLEIYLRVLEGETNDPFLDQINLGTGFYSNKEYWMQVESFRQGLFAESAMVGVLMERAREETKRELVRLIFECPEHQELRPINYPDPAEYSQEEYYQEFAEQIWESLGTEQYSTYQHRAILISRLANIGEDWTPPHWRMLKMRHEASQSKDARALDDLFGRVREIIGEPMNSEDVS